MILILIGIIKITEKARVLFPVRATRSIWVISGQWPPSNPGSFYIFPRIAGLHLHQARYEVRIRTTPRQFPANIYDNTSDSHPPNRRWAIRGSAGARTIMVPAEPLHCTAGTTAFGFRQCKASVFGKSIVLQDIKFALNDSLLFAGHNDEPCLGSFGLSYDN